MGPLEAVRDFGAAHMTAVASLLGGEEEDQITAALNGLPDPAGTFYRYSLPSSLLARRHP